MMSNPIRTDCVLIQQWCKCESIAKSISNTQIPTTARYFCNEPVVKEKQHKPDIIIIKPVCILNVFTVF